eukprot:m.4786 g.4786  ORF g.4786 m.4786 type:complete len:383 (+) comp3102_c0_seq1:54-1202(+)
MARQSLQFLSIVLGVWCSLSMETPQGPTVYSNAVYGVNLTSNVIYGQGMYCSLDNFSQTNCSVVNLTMDVILPVVNLSQGIPLLKDPRPVLLGIHGGSYSHGDSSEQVPNVEYFVQRGWIGFSINYRLCEQGRMLEDKSDGSLVCAHYGQFPAHGPFGNTSCTAPGYNGPLFGLSTHDGCALSSPPKHGSFFGTLLSWMYPSVRDAKAAVRFIRANTKRFNIDPDYITAVGSSAGACSVVGLATTLEDDYKNEISQQEDPTLSSTNLEQTSNIASGLVQWGGDYVPIFTQLRDPKNMSRYSKNNAPLATYHGDLDGTIGLAQENTTKNAYEKNGVPYEQHVLHGAGHDAINAPVVLPNGTNQTQNANMFEFVTRIHNMQIHN